jgi:hypothetical protein
VAAVTPKNRLSLEVRKDAELTNLIAVTAIEAGFGVNFDGKAN